VVGQQPHPRLELLRDHPKITLTGRVDDIRPYLHAADVYVAPLRMGSGTRLKLLEAMVMERAVVSTRIGAEGLDVQHGSHLLLADSPAEFAEAVIVLLRDQSRRVRIGQQAARLVRERYDWRAIIPAVEAIYG
jgi:glycosyltransferase involved in cell wall biosynthesis